MNVFLWVLQIALAAIFTMAAVVKGTRPKEKLVTSLPWVEDFSPGTVKLIAVLELVGAIGLIVPAVTGVLPVLTPLAATGLAIVMGLALNTHRRRHEPSGIATTAVLFVAAVVVAWGRFGPYSF
jgi:hypothetical protein